MLDSNGAAVMIARVGKSQAKTPKKRKRDRKKPTGVCIGAKIIAKPNYMPNEVAEILGVGRSTIADKMRSGELKYETPFGPTQGFQRGPHKKKLPEIRRIPYDELLRIAPSLANRMINKAP